QFRSRGERLVGPALIRDSVNGEEITAVIQKITYKWRRRWRKIGESLIRCDGRADIVSPAHNSADCHWVRRTTPRSQRQNRKIGEGDGSLSTRVGCAARRRRGNCDRARGRQ